MSARQRTPRVSRLPGVSPGGHALVGATGAQTHV